MLGLLVRRRIWVHRRVLAALGFTLILAVAAAAATAISVEGSAEGTLQSTLDRIPSSERFVDVAVTGAQVTDPDGLDTAFRAMIADRVTAVPETQVWRRAVSESYALPSSLPGRGDALTVLGEYDDLDEHARLRAGAWPEAGGEVLDVAIPDAAADRLGLAVGDTLALTNRLDQGRVTVRVVGRFVPADAEGAFWSSERLAARGFEASGSYRTYGPLMTAPGVLAGLPSGELRWRVVPDLSRLQPDDVAVLRTQVSELAGSQGSLRIESGDDATEASVETELDDALAATTAPIAVARTAVLLPGVMVALLAVSTLLLLGRLLADFRRDGTALLLARGLSSRQVVAASLVEGAALTVPAVVMAPWLGLVLARAEAFGLLTWLVVAAVGVAATGLLAAAGWTPAARRSDGGRGQAALLVARTSLEAGVVILAVFAALQLWRYRGESLRSRAGDLGVDPLLVLTPMLVLLGGTLLAVRLLDLAFGSLDRPARRRRGLVGALAIWHVTRQHAGRRALVLLLVLASAVGAFGTTYVTGWTGSQRDQVDQAIGADVRVTGLDDVDESAAAVRALPEVGPVAPVVRARPTVAGDPLELLAVDTTTIGRVLTPEAPSGRTWEEVVDRLSATGPAESIPAVVSADLAGVAGDDGRLLVGVEGRDVELDIVATVPEVPGVDSREAGGAMVDLAALRAAVPGLIDSLTIEHELWLAADRAALAEVRAVADDVAPGASVRDRWSEVDAALGGPVGSALLAALAMALVAALVFALIAVLAGASVELRRRRPELAALRAIGLGGGSLGRSLVLERVLVVTVAALGGLVIGAVAGRLLVPWLVLTDQALAPVPAVDVRVPWLALAGFLAAVVVLSTVLVVPLARSAARLVVSDQLRFGEDT